MKYIITSNCKISLDILAAMYTYMEFIQMTGFEAFCYMNDTLDLDITKILKENNILLNWINQIGREDNVILIEKKGSNNRKSNISPLQVTEILSNKSNTFLEYINANIKVEKNVKLISTVIIERYREYHVMLSKKAIQLLYYVYSKEVNLEKRDQLIKEYLEILMKEQRGETR